MTSNQPWWLTMLPAELAATILPLFSSDTWQDSPRWLVGIVSWFNTGSYSPPSDLPLKSIAVSKKVEFENPDFRAVLEAIQVLEHAGLVVRGLLGSDPVHRGLTRLGMHALQTNTVRQHLGLGDAPPTT